MATEYTEVYPYRVVQGQRRVLTEAEGEIAYMTLTATGLPAGTYRAAMSIIPKFTTAADNIRWRVSGAITSPEEFIIRANSDIETTETSNERSIIDWPGGDMTLTIHTRIEGPGQSDVTLVTGEINLERKA